MKITFIALISATSLHAATIITQFSQTGNMPQAQSASLNAVSVTDPYYITIPFSLNFNGSSNLGFRVYSESETNGTFSFVWKSDINGGQPSFSSGNSSMDVIGTDPNYDLDDPTAQVNIEGDDFELKIHVTPEPGQNPGQYDGTYTATLTDITNGTTVVETTTPIEWTGSNLGLGQIDDIVFFNSSSGTTVNYEDVHLVPEPSSVLLAGLASIGFILRRKR